MIEVTSSGSWARTEAWLRACSKQPTALRGILERGAQAGVMALQAATPWDTGNTAAQWDYVITMSPVGFSIQWTNANVNDGVPIAVILQYGHGTGTGGYVPGVDYINPAMKPIFETIEADIWKAVTKL